MTDEQLIAAGTMVGGARRLERQAFLHAIRPIAADFASMLLFYLVLIATGDVRAGTILGIALGIAQVAVLAMRRKPIPAMLAASALLLVILGALTLWLHDPRFVLIKTTIFYLVIGGAMLKRGWMARYLPSIVAGRVPARMVSGFGLAWAVLILGTGVLNAVLTFTLPARAVAAIVAPWAIGSKLALFAIQYALFRRAVYRHVRASIGSSRRLAR